MIKSLRLRLTLTFVGLSTLLVLCLGGLGLVFMHEVLTAELDEHARVLMSEFGHAIDLDGDRPFFRDWKRVVQTDPQRGLAAIVLFDSNGNLLEHYGPTAISHRMQAREASAGAVSYRIRSTALIAPSGKTIGFLQIEVPTTERDNGLRRYGLLYAVLAPLLLLGLAVTSYFVSGKAVKPLEDNVESMRKFLADAGHELNTPLAIISARAESLQRKLQRTELGTADTEVILKSAERTSRLATDLLLLSELEQSKAPRHSSLINIDDLLMQLVQDFTDRFEQKNIRLDYKVDSKATLYADSDDLYRAIANLIENALRYTCEGGTVRVMSSRNDDALLLTIQDAGIGIPAESLEKIFDRFYRVDHSRARASGGSGLGLAITKVILENHGARVSAESTLGKGSKFQIVFPIGTSTRLTTDTQQRQSK